MKIRLYNVSESKNTLDKDVTSYTTMEGTLRDRCDLLSPVVMVVTDPTSKNYAYIEELGRYYFIDDIEIYRKGVWILHMSIDVLMTYNADIKAMVGVVSRRADGSEYAEHQVVKDVRKHLTKVEWNYTFTAGTKVLVAEGSNGGN